MAFFDSHIDGELKKLGFGSLPPRRFRRVVRHSRNCHRCAALYERSIRVLRQLEHQSPFVPSKLELDAITELNAPSAGARLPRLKPLWGLGLGGVVVASALVMLVTWRAHSVDDFAVRGTPASTAVALRTFCGGLGQPLAELKEGGRCRVGQSLAFAVGASPKHEHAWVQVTGTATRAASTALFIAAVTGAEEPVSLTSVLERTGEVEVVVAFAADGEGAKAAALGAGGAEGAVILRQTLTVVP